MNITKNLTYKEVVKNNHNFKNEPTAEQLKNITDLAVNIFEPVRTHFNKPIIVNSCFRCAELNKKIGGAASSQHLAVNGAAIDIEATDGFTNEDIFNYIVDNLLFDQCINENGFAWVHVSYNKNKNRKEVLKMDVVNGKKVYTKIK